MGNLRFAACTAPLKDVTPAARRIPVSNEFSDVGSCLTLPFLIIYIGEVRGLGIAFAGVAATGLLPLRLRPLLTQEQDGMITV